MNNPDPIGNARDNYRHLLRIAQFEFGWDAKRFNGACGYIARDYIARGRAPHYAWNVAGNEVISTERFNRANDK